MAEEEALRFGLQHPIMSKKIRGDRIKCRIEKLVYTLETRYKAKIEDEMKDQIKFYVRKFMNEAKTLCGTRSNQALHRSLKSLADDESIKVCKFDKGRGVVVLISND